MIAVKKHGAMIAYIMADRKTLYWQALFACFVYCKKLYLYDCL